MKQLFQLIPHPERACEPLLGSDDGKWIFERLFAALEKITVVKTKQADKIISTAQISSNNEK